MILCPSVLGQLAADNSGDIIDMYPSSVQWVDGLYCQSWEWSNSIPIEVLLIRAHPLHPDIFMRPLITVFSLLTVLRSLFFMNIFYDSSRPSLLHPSVWLNKNVNPHGSLYEVTSILIKIVWAFSAPSSLPPIYPTRVTLPVSILILPLEFNTCNGC